MHCETTAIKQLPQKLRKQDISAKTHGSINQSLHPIGTHTMNYFASSRIFMHQGCRMQKVTKSL